jgi:hypothetical protein
MSGLSAEEGHQASGKSGRLGGQQIVELLYSSVQLAWQMGITSSRGLIRDGRALKAVRIEVESSAGFLADR